MSSGLVSIVMPAYNAADYISATLDSVIAQTYIDWELIIVDDCSSDDTVSVVQSYIEQDSRIELIKLSSNCGAPAHPRNVGVRAANGKWVALLDSDDIWHPSKLQLQMEALANTGASFCSTQLINFKHTSEICFGDRVDTKIQKVSFKDQLIKFRTPTSSVVLKRDLLLKFPFNEDLKYKAREDMLCWLQVLEYLGGSIKIQHPLLYYRIVDGQISGNKLPMAKRTLLVLNDFQFSCGKKLGLSKYLYFFTHMALSFYLRVIKKTL